MKWHEALEQADRSRRLKTIERLLKHTAKDAPMVLLRVHTDKDMSKWTALGWTVLQAPVPNIYGASQEWLLQRPVSDVRSDAEALR